jgi:hypothetical protein
LYKIENLKSKIGNSFVNRKSSNRKLNLKP